MAVHHLIRRGVTGGSPLHPLRGLLFASQEVGRRPLSSAAEYLNGAREEVKQLLKATSCHPILVRLGWHDAGTYDKNITEWPKCGGANGSLRFEIELKHAANAGLLNALKLIQPIKEKYSGVTYADLFQLASATAIEEAGGPKIPMVYGRVDVAAPEQCPPEGRLPENENENEEVEIATEETGADLNTLPCANTFQDQGMPHAGFCDCCGKVVWDGEPPKDWTIEWVPASPPIGRGE